MKKKDVICPNCGAGFRRIELSSEEGKPGDYHCPVCNTALEILNGDNLVAYRLTIQPSVRTLKS